MKYEYKTATGIIVVEITDDWCEILKDLDREEQNNEHKETRRHSTLNNDIDDYEWLAIDDPNLEVLLGKKEISNVERLHSAFKYLSDSQKALLKDLYVNGLTEAQIAHKEGVTQQAISCRLRKIFKKIKKYF
ncbi:MAG: sigma-70 family RNA polymerase sigma factor [Clostridiales bacterium]|nr:sigma-70 family RNA polymerase sigma factor [Clostridiales bacterium]